MLQFMIGLSSLNVNWLLATFFGGMRLYNSPPLFFVGGMVLLATRFYGFSLRPEILKFIFIVGAWGTAVGVMHGFDNWHLRQTVAYIVAAVTWVYVYHVGWKTDIYTLERTKIILMVFLVYFLVVSVERVFGITIVAYLASCIFSHGCGGNINYIESSRYPFFSEEPSAAVLGIAATVMPFLCANAVVNRSWGAFGLVCVGLVLMRFAEGLTSQIFLAFSVGFIVLPRLAVIAVPAVMGLIIGVSASVSYLLGESGGITWLVQHWFGGLTTRMDAGIDSGSYVARAMVWLIGARAFMSAPITGLGIGGTQSYFYILDKAGFYVAMGGEQTSMVEGDTAAYSSPMVVRIPAEIGIIGSLYVGYYGWKAMRLALRRQHPEPMLQYAFLYSFGIMLLSFCFAPELLNPCITGFVALLAQNLRTLARAAGPQPAPQMQAVPLLQNLNPGTA